MTIHPELYSVKTVAERIAGASAVAEADVTAVARFLRVMLGRKLIAPSVVPQGGGVTAPNLFDEAGLYRVAILVAISRLGVSDDMLSAAAPYLEYLEGERDPRALVDALAELKQGTPVYFHLFVEPKYFSRPGNVRRGTLSLDRDGGSEPWALTVTVPLQGLVANGQEDEDHDLPLPPNMKSGE